MNDQSSSAGPSILLRFARWLARTLVDASPEDRKKWGQALSSETEAIQEPLDALRWALGGFRLFARAWTSYAGMWLSLPVGASANDTAAFAAGPAPRRSRLFTFVLLAATVTLLLVPQGREAVRTLISCWRFRDSKHDERILQAMTVKAERSQDARTLAFVALARKNLRLDNQETERIADRAVELDPSLAWIYTGYGFRQMHEVWLSRMKAADPENGMVDLLAADAIREQKYLDLIRIRAPRAYSEREIEASVENDSRWFSHLYQALRAPRYESYNDGRLLELFREVYGKNLELSPRIFFGGFYGFMEPGGAVLRTYISILVRRGEEARSPDELRKAVEGLTSLEDYGARLAGKTKTRSETWCLGTWIIIDALKGEKELFTHRGLIQESATANVRLEEAAEAWRKRGWGVSFCRMPNLRKEYTVHGLLLLMIVLSLWLSASILLFELIPAKKLRIRPRLQRIAAFAVDCFPAVLILNGIALLALFQPYARAFSALVSGNLTQRQSNELLSSYQNLFYAPGWMLSNANEVLWNSYLDLIIFTAVISAGAVLIRRGFLRLVRRLKESD